MKSLVWHLFLPVVYGVVMCLTLTTITQKILFILGVEIGFSFFFLDRIGDIFFVRPELEFSQKIQREVRAKKFLAALKNMLFHSPQQQLTTRSALFFIAYLFLSLFVLTSTGSILGIGIVLGIGLHYCFDFLVLSRHVQTFQQTFLWQVKTHVSKQQIQRVVIAFTLFFALLSLIIFIRS